MLEGVVARGLPNLTPFSFAIRIPSACRSLILFLSFLATNDNTCNTISLINLPTRFFPSILVSRRGIDNLLEIRDHYPKYVVCMDKLEMGNENGVELVYIADFLLQENW